MSTEHFYENKNYVDQNFSHVFIVCLTFATQPYATTSITLLHFTGNTHFQRTLPNKPSRKDAKNLRNNRLSDWCGWYKSLVRDTQSRFFKPRLVHRTAMVNVLAGCFGCFGLVRSAFHNRRYRTGGNLIFTLMNSRSASRSSGNYYSSARILCFSM